MIGDWTSLRYAVVDVEGNGQQPPDLVELGVLPIVDGVVGAPATWLVRPARPITSIARKIHGIANDDVANAPDVNEIADEVREALTDAAVIAHNAHVDVDVLARSFDWSCNEVFDTLKLARRLLPGQPSYRLGALVETFQLAVGLPDDLTPHRVEYDVLVTARLFLHIAAARSLHELRGLPRPEDIDGPSTLF